MGMGVLFGPLIGALMYWIGGYQLPFYVSAGVILITIVMMRREIPTNFDVSSHVVGELHSEIESKPADTDFN